MINTGPGVRRRVLPVQVLDRLSYVDSLRLYLPSGVPKQLDHDLRQSVKSNPDDGKVRYFRERFSTEGGGWMAFAWIHQPTLRTIEVLGETNVSYRLVSVHVALDLLVGSATHAELLGRYLAARLVKSGKGSGPRQPLSWSPEGSGDDRYGPLPPKTMYLSRMAGKRKRGVEVALYYSRPTKTASNSPCVHLEWRIYGSTALRASEMHSLERVALLDHRAFWANRLHLLRAPNAKGVAAAIEKARKQRFESDAIASSPRIANRLFRAASVNGDGEVSAHDLMHYLSKSSQLQGHRPRRLFQREGTNWMLPNELNALWRPLQN